MTNKEDMIKGMKLLKEGCENICSCNPIDCPLYEYCYERFADPPCDWTVIEERNKNGLERKND